MKLPLSLLAKWEVLSFHTIYICIPLANITWKYCQKLSLLLVSLLFVFKRAVVSFCCFLMKARKQQRIWAVIPFHATGLFLYPLKTSQNQRFSDVFMGYRKRIVARNVLALTRFLKMFNFASKPGFFNLTFFYRYLKIERKRGEHRSNFITLDSFHQLINNHKVCTMWCGGN